MKDKLPRGTIYPKNGYYYARISFYVDGKRKTKDRATGIKVDNSTKRKADRQERAALKIMEEMLAAFSLYSEDTKKDPKDQLITETAKEWLAHTCKSKAPGTIASYSTCVRDITLYFGAHPTCTVDLTSAHIESYLDWERQRRQPWYTGDDKVYSRYTDGSGIENTVHHRYTALRSILQYAVREGTIDRNVASKRDAHIQVPAPQRQEFSVLTQSEATRLIQALDSEPLWFRICVLLGLLLGLRRSEIIGICLSDINWEANTLTIRRTATQQTLDHKNTIIVKPFTKNRRPKIFTLSKVLCSALHLLAESHNTNSVIWGSSYNQNWNDYLIRYEDGKLVSPNVLTQHFHLFLTKNNLKIIRFHDLRHSCASILFANGTDILTIQEILGHAQLTTTIMYTHKISDSKTTALTQLSAQFLQSHASEKEESQN